MIIICIGATIGLLNNVFAEDRPPMPPIEAALDANSDGTISAEEIANSGTTLLTLDANSDGQLTSDEYMPQCPGGKSFSAKSKKAGKTKSASGTDTTRKLPPVLAALDADADGTISSEEITNAPTTLLTLDANSDGQISMDEIRPPRCGGETARHRRLLPRSDGRVGTMIDPRQPRPLEKSSGLSLFHAL